MPVKRNSGILGTIITFTDKQLIIPWCACASEVYGSINQVQVRVSIDF